MKELEFYLDGKINGIVALNEKGKIMTFSGYGIDGKYEQNIFKNFDHLYAMIEHNIQKYHDIAIVLGYKTKEQRVLPLSKLLKFGPDIYKYLDLEKDELSLICIEPVKERMISCGYFTFTDSPNEKIMDNKKGKQISNQCYKAVLNVR